MKILISDNSKIQFKKSLIAFQHTNLNLKDLIGLLKI